MLQSAVVLIRFQHFRHLPAAALDTAHLLSFAAALLKQLLVQRLDHATERAPRRVVTFDAVVGVVGRVVEVAAAVCCAHRPAVALDADVGLQHVEIALLPQELAAVEVQLHLCSIGAGARIVRAQGAKCMGAGTR